VDGPHWRYLLKEAMPLGAGVVLRRLTIHMHTLMLTALSGAVAVGLYNSAYRFLQMIEIGAVTLAGVLVPALSRVQKSSMAEFERLYGDGVRMLVLVSSVLAGVFVAVGNELALSIYGPAFAAAGPVLRVLGASLVFLVPGALLHSGFAALNRQSLFMRLAAVGIATNAVAGFFLIRNYQALGAACATLLTESVTFVIGAFMLRGEKVRVPYLDVYSRSALPAAVLAGIVTYFGPFQGWAALSAATIVFGIAFVLSVFMTGAIRLSELQALTTRRSPAGAPR
jgi:O-antigen/teichoic acid export membrane protein